MIGTPLLVVVSMKLATRFLLPRKKVRTREGVRIRLVHKSTIAIVKSLRRNSVQLFLYFIGIQIEQLKLA